MIMTQLEKMGLYRLNDFLQAIGKEPVGVVKGYEIID